MERRCRSAGITHRLAGDVAQERHLEALGTVLSQYVGRTRLLYNDVQRPDINIDDHPSAHTRTVEHEVLARQGRLIVDLYAGDLQAMRNRPFVRIPDRFLGRV